MLRKLASSYGVQTSYIDVHGERSFARPDIVLSVLRTLGAPLNHLDDVDEALRARRLELARQVLSPVVPVWGVPSDGVTMTLPAERGSHGIEASLHLENGDVREWSPSGRTVLRARTVEGETYLTTRFPLPSLPLGYHRLSMSIDGAVHEALLIRAPGRAFLDAAKPKRWGLFAPVYALHSERSAGVGNFSDLGAFMDWTRDHGGAFVATLPFLASFPGEPSPYSPLSRLFWNELFVDANAPRSTPAGTLDYETLHRAHRDALARLEADAESIERFQDAFPLVLDYARFRAASARYRAPWTDWPEPQRLGVLGADDVDEAEVSLHLRAQLMAEEQIAALGRGDTELYLDLPLGVHRHGYDTWREQSLFAHDVSVGAPPDAAFPGGQNWSTPPVLPRNSRLQEHRHLRLVYRHAMRHADILRVDHVMGLHRQFWIPEGADVADGVYVRCPADELYAILCLESHRARCELVGENLGIVPEIVNETMARHGLRELFVAQLSPDAPIPERSVASLNTHDTPTFAAHIGAPDEAALERAIRELMESSADLVSVALDDLWLEPESVNVPGTTSERPNWRRPLRFALEELDARVGRLVASFRR